MKKKVETQTHKCGLKKEKNFLANMGFPILKQ